MADRRLTRSQRRCLLAVHVTSSVALVGISMVQLALGVAAASAADGHDRRLLYGVMLDVVYAVTIPVAVVTVADSLLSSLLTPWGLLLHWWVMAKALLLVATVALAIAVLRPALAGGHHDGQARIVPVLVPALQIGSFAAATVISVLKPWGRTPRGQRFAASRHSGGRGDHA